MSELALKLIAQAKETRATRLELGNCGLTELPDELFELTWLEELILSDRWYEHSFEAKESKSYESENKGEANNIAYINQKIKKLKGLKKLIMSGRPSYRWDLSDLRPLKDLHQLQQLVIYQTHISDLNPLQNLTQLQQLNISVTQVEDLSALKNLKQLQYLNVRSTKISDLSPLKYLQQLKHFSVFDTQISDLRPLKYLIQLQEFYFHKTQAFDLSPLKDLQQLRVLNVFDTKVSDLSQLKNLKLLQFLNVRNTKVSDLSPLKELANLQQLYLASTQVSDLSPLKGLTALEELNIHNTQVSDLSPLKDLTALQRLDVDKSQVSDLSPLKELTNLQKVDVSLTQVSDLRPLKNLIEKGIELKLGDWENENGIYVKDCPLDKSLIAAIKKGNKAVLNYFNKPKQRLFEVRVLILGEPRAGKTTLRRKLKSVSAPMPTNAESTKAFEIEIEPYKCDIEKDGERNKLTYHLWDFGGQDYYRLLHQLFVAEQSVYIIVTDTDRNKNEEEIDFWLETIQRLGKDKNGNYGPVILFQNPKTHREGSDFVDLKKRYPFWKQGEQFVINLNALDEKNREGGYDKKQLDKFKRFKTYLEESFCQLDHIGKEMPTQWINVRKGLVKYEKDNWISVEDFNKVCAAKGITDVSEQDDLLGIFHTLGYVLHYKDTALRGMVILNREWVTDALYRVLDDETVKTNRGWFKKEDADTIWHEARYKNRTHELLALMAEFKLSYYNPASQKYIVPAKLPEDTEGLPTWAAEHPVRLHLQYDWMPRAVPTQLIVSLHNDIVGLENGEQWIWRKGAVLDGRHLGLKDVQVQIEDNWRENKIEITAKGTHSELLIRTIMRNWREVNQPFEDKVKVSKIILCACSTCIVSDRPHTFRYESVLNALEKSKALQCNESLEDFSAKDILRGVFDETTQLVDLAVSKNGHSDILNLISDGKIKEVLDSLPNDDKLILSFKTQYQHLVQDNMQGVMNYDTYRIGVNKIEKSLVEYLNSSRKDGFLMGGRHYLFVDEK